ncbi:MAG: LLM class flavin-dependent oxidoreductase [Actinomycetes bacterium]
MGTELNFGLDTFGDVTVNEDGSAVSAAQVIRDVVAQAQLADELGIYGFNVGEHHRSDFAVSAPDTVLAGIATVTNNIILGTGVTVLSSDDPVRVYQRFATVDALSNGRAEITAGRGSFIESFPLFGYDLGKYEILFEEKLDLLVEILKEGAVTWSGTTRAGLSNQQVYPKTEGGHMPLRVGVGGTPESVVRAARVGAQLALAIIGGAPERFAPFAQLYRDSLKEFGREPLPISIHSPGHIAATDEEAIEGYWPHYAAMHARIGRERGWSQITPEQFVNEITHGSLYVGSPQTVAKKIARAVTAVGAQRFDLKYASGTTPHSMLMTSIGLYGTEVIPLVRSLL